MLEGASKDHCLFMCDLLHGSTGCMWNDDVMQCAVHTQPITEGSEKDDGRCWTFEKCTGKGILKCELCCLYPKPF